jgi:uncharacterized protein (TIGR04255 family)
LTVSRHLPNAPIVEALIDFRVQVSPDFNVSLFTGVRSELASTYPEDAPVRSVQATLGLEDGQVVQPGAVVSDLGLMFKSADGCEVVQFRINGFTFNRLRPYTSWEDVFPRALHLWHRYVEIVQPVQVTRLAVRYINRIILPLPIRDFGDYMVAPPQIPDGLPQTLRAFLTRVVIHDAEADYSAIVTHALEPSIEPDSVILLLDIDAHKEGIFEAMNSDVERTFQALRHFKNQIFFKSLTPQTLRMFE